MTVERGLSYTIWIWKFRFTWYCLRWVSVNANRAHNHVSWCTFLTWDCKKSAFAICTYSPHWEFIGMPFCLWPTMMAHADVNSENTISICTHLSHQGNCNDLKIKNPLKIRHIEHTKSHCNNWIRRFGKIHAHTRKHGHCIFNRIEISKWKLDVDLFLSFYLLRRVETPWLQNWIHQWKSHLWHQLNVNGVKNHRG